MMGHMETETEAETKDVTETEKYKASEKDFDPIWKKYPNRQGKKSALRHFLATVKTLEDLSNICKSLDNYLQSGNVKNGYVKNGSTWFNEWQDWVEPTDVMMKGNSNGTTRQGSGSAFKPAPGTQAARATFTHDETELERLALLKESIDRDDAERRKRS
jgi:hypothetical protein